MALFSKSNNRTRRTISTRFPKLKTSLPQKANSKHKPWVLIRTKLIRKHEPTLRVFRKSVPPSLLQQRRSIKVRKSKTDFGKQIKISIDRVSRMTRNSAPSSTLQVTKAFFKSLKRRKFLKIPSSGFRSSVFSTTSLPSYQKLFSTNEPFFFHFASINKTINSSDPLELQLNSKNILYLDLERPNDTTSVITNFIASIFQSFKLTDLVNRVQRSVTTNNLSFLPNINHTNLNTKNQLTFFVKTPFIRGLTTLNNQSKPQLVLATPRRPYFASWSSLQSSCWNNFLSLDSVTGLVDALHKVNIQRKNSVNERFSYLTYRPTKVFLNPQYTRSTNVKIDVIGRGMFVDAQPNSKMSGFLKQTNLRTNSAPESSSVVLFQNVPSALLRRLNLRAQESTSLGLNKIQKRSTFISRRRRKRKNSLKRFYALHSKPWTSVFKSSFRGRLWTKLSLKGVRLRFRKPQPTLKKKLLKRKFFSKNLKSSIKVWFKSKVKLTGTSLPLRRHKPAKKKIINRLRRLLNLRYFTHINRSRIVTLRLRDTNMRRLRRSYRTRRLINRYKKYSLKRLKKNVSLGLARIQTLINQAKTYRQKVYRLKHQTSQKKFQKSKNSFLYEPIYRQLKIRMRLNKLARKLKPSSRSRLIMNSWKLPKYNFTELVASHRRKWALGLADSLNYSNYLKADRHTIHKLKSLQLYALGSTVSVPIINSGRVSNLTNLQTNRPYSFLKTAKISKEYKLNQTFNSETFFSLLWNSPILLKFIAGKVISDNRLTKVNDVATVYRAVKQLTTGSEITLRSFAESSKLINSTLSNVPNLNFVVRKKILKMAYSVFEAHRPDLTSLYNAVLIRFLEAATGRKTLLHFTPSIEESLTVKDRGKLYAWETRIAGFQRILGHKIFIKEGLMLVAVALRLKDPTFLANWIRSMLYRMSFWKYRLLFRYLKFLFQNLFRVVFDDFEFRGLKLQLKGKISVAGNARTRTLFYRVGDTSHSKANNKVAYDLSYVNTFTGILGFKLWFFY